MRVLKFLSCLLVASVMAYPAQAGTLPVINEIFADEGSGDTNEFIELFGPGGYALDGFSVIVIDNDNGGNTASSTYRRVNQQWDFTTETIPADGYFVLGDGPALAGLIDFPISVNDLQNGSQTYALVRTADIGFCDDAGDGCDSGGAGHVDTDELNPASIAAITSNALDIIATWNEDTGDLFDFAPIISQDFGVDAASRLPNGIDTNSTSDWSVFNTFDDNIQLGGPLDFFTTPGAANQVIPEPTTALLLLLGCCFSGAVGMRARLG